MLLLRFQQCLGPFTMLLVEGSSETGPFSQLSNHVFRSPLFRSPLHQLWGSSFLLNIENLIEILRMKQKCWGKKFYCWDKCIWIGCLKLSLLRTEYLSSEVNALTASLSRYSISLTETFSTSIAFAVINKYRKGTDLHFSILLVSIYPVLEGNSIKGTVLGQSQGKKTLTFPYTLFEAIFYCNRKTL